MSSDDLPGWARAGRRGWRWTGVERPPWAEPTAAGQESVWDYPRPPRLAPDRRHVVVRFGETVIADTRGAIRVLETASPPTVYLPPTDIAREHLRQAPGSSGCEWKGLASYRTVRSEDGRVAEQAAWSYEKPFAEFEAIRGYVSFYPAQLDCFIDGEAVHPQGGGFYGGWVTSEIVGPWKGDAAGSAGW